MTSYEDAAAISDPFTLAPPDEAPAIVVSTDDGRVLLRLDHRAETFDGAIEDMGEAARIFVNHVRAMLGMPGPMSTPPADDVREALDADVTAPWPNSMHQVWERLVEFSEVYKHERGYPPNEAARTRFLFAAFEVRPRGTVTNHADGGL